MSKETIVITGAARGIGFALAKNYAQKGEHVIALVRKASDELKALPVEIIEDIEFTDSYFPMSVTKALKDVSVDLVLNVAGVMKWEEFEDLDDEMIRKQIEINTIAPLMLTHSLRRNIKAGGKIVFLTSRLGSISNNESGKGYGYRMSKAALNMAAKSLSIDLKPQDIAVGIFHPGSVKTSLNQLGGEIEIEDAVAGLLNRIEGLSMKNTGQFLHQNGQSLVW